MSILNFFKSSAENDFSTQIHPHLKRLYHQAFRLTRHQYDAEDLVQQLLLHLYEKKIDLSSIEKPANWLLRALYNQFINNYRKKSRLPIDDKDAESEEIIDSLYYEKDAPHLLHENNATSRQLLSLISQLNSEQQALISLHDIEGHSLGELSEVMDVPLGTLKSRLHRARQTLREKISLNNAELMEPFVNNIRFVK